MVTDSITDGKRIAQLLASEITGLQTGGLSAVSVADADPDAMPSDTGTLAYRVLEDETELASVYLYPSYIELQFGVPRPTEQTAGGEPVEADNETVQVTTGADVKGAVDLIRETVEYRNSS
ncbi:MAG: hypothetical protein ACOCY1_01565 [Halovenus sp.]